METFDLDRMVAEAQRHLMLELTRDVVKHKAEIRAAFRRYHIMNFNLCEEVLWNRPSTSEEFPTLKEMEMKLRLHKKRSGLPRGTFYMTPNSFLDDEPIWPKPGPLMPEQVFGSVNLKDNGPTITLRRDKARPSQAGYTGVVYRRDLRYRFED